MLRIAEIIKQNKENNFSNIDLLKKASLLFEYSIEEDFGSYSSEDILQLRTISLPRKGGKSVLPDEIRIRILKENIRVENLIKEIDNENLKNDFCEVLKMLINSEQVDYGKLDINQLYYCSKVVEIFPDKLDKDKLNIELQRKYYFAPFEKITRKFAGRKQQLDIIAEYVDWLPKTSFISNAKSILRSIINWHEKPPLLIKGVGGVGKSTLIAKFILDHSFEKNGKTLPFVYIDFDLPGFSVSEPLYVLIEGMRQLSIQFPVNSTLITKLSSFIIEQINDNGIKDKQNHYNSSESSRMLIFKILGEMLKETGWNLEEFNNPVLVVFDSFEEMEYRAKDIELSEFFNFIEGISKLVPRFRPVFISRSEINRDIAKFKCEEIEITSFDQESACSLLEKIGVNDDELKIKIFKFFGGNPLMLHMAAHLAINDELGVNEINIVIERKHEFLVSRIMDQIHDADVRKIAVPGMVLRFISPEIIKNVLANPCGLENVDNTKAGDIFEKLKKETALILSSEKENELYFRQDLRMECENLIKNKYLRESELIQKQALKFYEENREFNQNYEAEYYYHSLRLGVIPDDLTPEVFNRIRSRVEKSINEFPNNTKLYFETLAGIKSSDAILTQSDTISWEKHYSELIKNALNSDLNYLINLEKELSKRKERSNHINSDFPRYEALLYQRLNKLKDSNNIIEKFNRNNPLLFFDQNMIELEFIKAQNYDYLGEYERAREICNKIKPFLPRIENKFLGNKFLLLIRKLDSRCNVILQDTLELFKTPIYSTRDNFTDTNWIASQSLIEKGVEINSGVEFNIIYEKLSGYLKDMIDLEMLCRNTLGKFLHDISLQGDFNIVLKDFLWILELNNKLKNLVVIFDGLNKLYNMKNNFFHFLNSSNNMSLECAIGFSQILNLSSKSSFSNFSDFLKKNNFTFDVKNDQIILCYEEKDKEKTAEMPFVSLEKYIVPIYERAKMLKVHNDILSGRFRKEILEILEPLS